MQDKLFKTIKCGKTSVWCNDLRVISLLFTRRCFSVRVRVYIIVPDQVNAFWMHTKISKEKLKIEFCGKRRRKTEQQQQQQRRKKLVFWSIMWEMLSRFDTCFGCYCRSSHKSYNLYVSNNNHQAHHHMDNIKVEYIREIYGREQR